MQAEGWATGAEQGVKISRLDQDPQGHFPADDAALIVGVPVSTLRAWSRARLIEPSVARAPVAIFAFQDVAQSLVVRELLRREMSAKDIRRAKELLTARWGRWPLLSAELYTEHVPRTTVVRDQDPSQPRQTDERTILAVRDGGAFYEFNRGGFEQVFDERAREPLEDMVDVLRSGGWPAREQHLVHIEIDPDRLGGRPTIRGRRLGVEFVALASAQDDWAELREAYDLTDEEIEDAVAWWDAAEALSLAV